MELLPDGLIVVYSHNHSFPITSTKGAAVGLYFKIGSIITIVDILKVPSMSKELVVGIDMGGFIENPIPDVSSPLGRQFEIVTTQDFGTKWVLRPLDSLASLDYLASFAENPSIYTTLYKKSGGKTPIVSALPSNLTEWLLYR